MHSEVNKETAEGNTPHLNGNILHRESDTLHRESNVLHREGTMLYVEGNKSHAEGDMLHREGNESHVEGTMLHREGNESHGEGNESFADSIQPLDKTPAEPIQALKYHTLIVIARHEAISHCNASQPPLARYEIGFRNALAREIEFRFPAAMYIHVENKPLTPRNRISREIAFRNPISERAAIVSLTMTVNYN